MALAAAFGSATVAATGSSAGAPATGPVALAGQTALGAQAGAPSGEAMPVGDLPGWRQIFTDDFTTAVALGSFPAAVSSKWTAYPSPWKDTSGHGTYSPSSVVSISGGVLTENIHTSSGTPMVAAISPKLPGPLTYGRFAVRYRFDSFPGYKTAWMLWPDSGNSQKNGEIDFPEMNLDDSVVWAFDHHINNTGPDDKAWFKAPLPPGGWHTTVVEWSPNQVVFLFDGMEIGRNTVRVANTPMHWVLQTETELGVASPPAPSARGNVQIDWAAAWAYDPATADTTAPTVSLTAPTTGATARDTMTVSATASDNKGVVGLQFELDGVPLGAEDTAAPYTTSWNANLTTAGPHTLTAVARDNAGNFATSAPVTVTVSHTGDSTAPTALLSPKANATIFPIAAGMTATFSESVTGVSSSSFTLKNQTTGATIPSSVSYRSSANTSMAILDPAANLTNDTRYTATLTSGIKDLAGNPLSPISWSFVTGPPPTARVSSPAAGATNVARTNNVTATANETITRVGNSTFSLTSSSGAVVPATVTYNATTKVATLDPKVTLNANARYTALLTSGVKDLVGNPLTPLTWSFTTGP